MKSQMRTAIGLLGVMTASICMSAGTPKEILISKVELPRAAAWCNCQITRRVPGGSGELLLVSTFSPNDTTERVAWMNFAGANVELHQKRKCSFMTPGDKGALEQCEFLKSGYVVSTQLFLISRQKGAYTTKGMMRIFKGGSKLDIEVEGRCGCSA